jgi:hypothetical protein
MSYVVTMLVSFVAGHVVACVRAWSRQDIQ